jgi:hypothetical protein
MFKSPAVKSVLVAGVFTFLGAAALAACGSSSSGSSATSDAGSDADTTVDGNVGPTDASTGDGAVQALTWTGSTCRGPSAATARPRALA